VWVCVVCINSWLHRNNPILDRMTVAGLSISSQLCRSSNWSWPNQLHSWHSIPHLSLSLSQSFSHFSFLFSLFLTCFLSLFLPPFILFLFRSFAFSFSLFLPARETIQIGVRVDHWRKSMVGGFFYLWACPTLCPVRNCYNRVWATMDWLRLRQPPPILVPNPGTFPLFVWWKLLSRGENE